MKIDLSIIIPVYNSEKYIENLLKSLLNQLDEKVEVHIIDDGSNDNTKRIIHNMIINKSNIYYTYQKNSGVAEARNTGLKLARGKYVYFCDSDDILLPNAINLILSKIETDNDIIFFAHNENISNKTIKYFEDIEKNYEINEDMLNKCFYNSSFAMVLWDKVLKRSIITDNKIKFNLSTLEDYLFLYNVFKNSENILFVPISIYMYYVRDESYSRKYRSDYYSNLLKVYNYILQDLNNEKYINNLNKWFSRNLRNIKSVLISDRSITFINKLKEYKKMKKSLFNFIIDYSKVKIKRVLKDGKNKIKKNIYN